jgi:hypothetical protein
MQIDANQLRDAVGSRLLGNRLGTETGDTTAGLATKTQERLRSWCSTTDVREIVPGLHERRTTKLKYANVS